MNAIRQSVSTLDAEKTRLAPGRIGITLILLASALVSLGAQETVQLIPKASNPRAWRMTAYESAASSLVKESDGSLRATVVKTGSQGWHAELYIGGLRLVEGGSYTLSFKARADAARSYAVGALLDESPYNATGPSFRIDVSPEFKEFSFTFTATRCDGKRSRAPYIPMGLIKGTLWIKDVSLTGPEAPRASAAKIPDGFFPYALDWNDTLAGTATDASALNDAPAGRNGRIIARDGRLYESVSGKRVRFFGTNIAGPALFPDKEDAELVARRLAKAGVNIVRLHGVDSEWGGRSGNIFKDGEATHREFDEEKADRFDYLVYQLKKNGVYVDLNLKVFKTLNEADGFPRDIKDIPFDFQKRVDVFDERMIGLQLDHARRILSRVNKYTGKRYADDECVAVVECNNENSLLDYWSNALGTRLDELPPYFKAELVSLWNAWLLKKYRDDDALLAAWNAGVEPLSEPLFGPEAAWFFNRPDPSWMEAKQEKPGKDRAAREIELRVKKIDGGAEWKCQGIIPGLRLEDGASYTVEFSAMSDAERTIGVSTQKDGADWHNMGLASKAALTASWTDFSFPFTATAIGNDKTSLVFTVGNKTGLVRIRGVRLMRGLKEASLGKGRSLKDGSVPMPEGMGKAQRADWIDFLVATERSYSDRMRSLVKDELGCKALLSVTQIDYGGTTGYAREERMDYADAHAYWQHPVFPGAPWDPNDWSIGNTPQVDAYEDRDFGEMGRLARLRVAGRPFSVSEYDHPAPSDYAAEYLPLYASFASYQDWDMIYTFAMGSFGSFEEPDKIGGYFDQNNHPAKWSFYPIASRIFRKGLIPAASKTVTLELAPEPWKRNEYVLRAWDALLPPGPAGFLSRSFSASPSTTGRVHEKDAVIGGGFDASSPLAIKTLRSGRVFTAESKDAFMCSGYLGRAVVELAGARIESAPFTGDFAALGAASLDGKPLAASSRILLCVAGRVENQGVRWNASRTSIGSAWGSGPCIAQRVPVRIELARNGPARIWALNSKGERVKEVKTDYKGGRLAFSPMANADSLLFEIVSGPAD